MSLNYNGDLSLTNKGAVSNSLSKRGNSIYKLDAEIIPNNQDVMTTIEETNIAVVLYRFFRIVSESEIGIFDVVKVRVTLKLKTHSSLRNYRFNHHIKKNNAF